MCEAIITNVNQNRSCRHSYSILKEEDGNFSVGWSHEQNVTTMEQTTSGLVWSFMDMIDLRVCIFNGLFINEKMVYVKVQSNRQCGY